MAEQSQMPVVRVSRGTFAPEKLAEVQRLIAASERVLAPAIRALVGLLYYHAGVDAHTNTVVNVSVWVDETSAKQMDTLAPMLAQRPILESAGVRFDRIANYAPAWKIEQVWKYGG
jgi:hypothetical protein